MAVCKGTQAKDWDNNLLLTINIPYFAMYNVHYFWPNFSGKNEDVHYPWVVLFPYRYKCFNSFICAYVLIL